MRRILTIMPDYGNAAYAWIRDEGSPDTSDIGQAVGSDGSVNDRHLGGNIGDATGFCTEEFPVSKELQEDFADWAIQFELYADFRRFNWEHFHERGLVLARRLKKEVGNKAIVRYEKPCEDPNFRTEEISIIE